MTNGREAQAQSRTVRKKENMPGPEPGHVWHHCRALQSGSTTWYWEHTNLRCNRQALKRHPMVMFIEGPRPLEEGARAARGGAKHVLGRSVLVAFETRAGHAGSEDMVALHRALFVRTFTNMIKVRDRHECGAC